MPSQRDPEGIVTRYIYEFADLTNARVLDIGCGDGYLTWRIAPGATHVVGIDPKATSLSGALRDRPVALQTKVGLAQARGEALPFPSGIFDVAILSWTL